METNIEVNLPVDFTTLCTIYQIKPETLIQLFINSLSFPCFYSNPMGSSRWATYLFLDYLDNEETVLEVDSELEEQYLTLFNRKILELLEQNGDTRPSEEAGRKIMAQWLKAVLAERTKYITDNL
ncbi:hypothetical protein [Pedobacter sp. L105]|uniref:hypothetical protein n=1 Tax=Pedobacter sp. L105 TaxID=1641871 RepID=UPI00131D5371|nr:hypothetical protein [Pedobacter sp. L105]